MGAPPMMAIFSVPYNPQQVVILGGPAIGSGTGNEPLPPIATVPAGNCLFNPWMLIPVNGNGNEACVNRLGSGFCIRTSLTQCEWSPTQISNYFDTLPPGENVVRLPEHYNWNIASATSPET